MGRLGEESHRNLGVIFNFGSSVVASALACLATLVGEPRNFNQVETTFSGLNRGQPIFLVFMKHV